MGAPDRLLEAWAVLRAAAADERVIRVEPAGLEIEHGPVLAGLDNSGGRHLLVPVPDAALVREDRRSAGVQLRQATLEEVGQTRAFVDVVCLVPRLNDLFADVAADMIEALAIDESAPARVCQQVLERWRELLERPDPRLLGPQQLAGLFGELLVVRDLAVLAPSDALDAWTGPAKDQHDFIRGSLAVEVKTTTVREGRVVQIHGVQQLEPPGGGELFLAFARLDVEANGTSVPDLVESVLDAGVDRRLLIESLARAGYDSAQGHEYEFPKFVVRERRLYAVEGGFPRIVGSSFASERIPAGVLRIRYDIDLTGEPPDPVDPTSTERIWRRLAAA